MKARSRPEPREVDEWLERILSHFFPRGSLCHLLWKIVRPPRSEGFLFDAACEEVLPLHT